MSQNIHAQQGMMCHQWSPSMLVENVIPFELPGSCFCKLGVYNHMLKKRIHLKKSLPITFIPMFSLSFPRHRPRCLWKWSTRRPRSLCLPRLKRHLPRRWGPPNWGKKMLGKVFGEIFWRDPSWSIQGLHLSQIGCTWIHCEWWIESLQMAASGNRPWSWGVLRLDRLVLRSRHKILSE